LQFRSGNVFADLGVSNSEQELVRAKLTLQIYRLIKERKLTQAAAADILGVKQPHVSQVTNNRAGSFSVGRLIEFLAALGHDVNISVARSKTDHDEMSVTLGEH
jgi:predicted XRE-type DNA-binding protein